MECLTKIEMIKNSFGDSKISPVLLASLKSSAKIETIHYSTKIEGNRLTRKEVKHPLNEIASSHLARRTFAGNIYRQVKDPNLVASLTGHAEGSRAFNRYREIDLGMKQDLVRILENKRG